MRRPSPDRARPDHQPPTAKEGCYEKCNPGRAVPHPEVSGRRLPLPRRGRARPGIAGCPDYRRGQAARAASCGGARGGFVSGGPVPPLLWDRGGGAKKAGLGVSSATKNEAALYHRRGWCPIPVKERSKATSLVQLAPYLKRRATKEELNAWTWNGVGIVTGPLSGLLVLDVDGERGEEKLKELGHPVTPMVRTPSGGLHLYFKHPGGDVRTGIRVAPELDVKAAGGYVVAPPSVGPNGRPYEWIISPDDAEEADPPEWIMRLLKRPPRRGAAPPVGKKIPPGSRNQELASIAGTMRRRGMEEPEILAALRTANELRCEPPLEAEEVEKIASSVARYAPARPAEPAESDGDVVHVSFNRHGTAQPPHAYNLTDLGNAERFIAQHGENVRYCYPWRKWLVQAGTRWWPDDAGRVHRLAKDTVRSIYREAADPED